MNITNFYNLLDNILSEHSPVTSLETLGQTISPKVDSDITQPVIVAPRPSIELNEDGSISKIIVSQSLISRFFRKGEVLNYCPMKLYKVYILKTDTELPSKAMIAGQFFETLAIGSTAYGAVTSLPIGKSGKVPVDQKRIEEQALNFRLVCEQHGIIINKEPSPGKPKNVQKNFYIPIEIEEFAHEGIETVINMTVDILSPISYGQVEYPMGIIDLKLTWDRNSTYGDYCWGAPEYMDHIQAYIYGFILGFPFFYLVFDYNSKDRGHKIVPINTNLNHSDAGKKEEAMRRYRETIEIIKSTLYRIMDHHHHGWYTNPSYDNCKSCPLDCLDRNKNQEI